jgi:opacity protein-like surface antigen
MERCTGPDRSVGGRWENEFEGATGILAGAAAGYSFAGQAPNQPWGGLRVELEYLYRQSNYDQTADIFGGAGTQQDKLADEIVQATDRIGSMTSHNLFGNLFYDFSNTSRFTPYIGIGGGVGFTDMEYGSVWARNSDASRISTGDGLPNADMINQNLASTASFEDTTLSDTLWGFQFLFGVDYAMTEAMSLGLKGRYVMFNSFDSGQGSLVWDPLRGHQPNLRLDGSEPVAGGSAPTTSSFSVSA